MGLLVNGQWHDQWYDTTSTGGKFIRADSKFRNWVTVDGAPGPSGVGGFKAESGRYHLYVSFACPWAHRTLIFRALKGFQEVISVSVVQAKMLASGWAFGSEQEGTNEHLHGFEFFHQVYTQAQADFSGRVTVPVLWDKKQNTIVSNESSEIIRMFNSAFDDFTDNKTDYYPVALRTEIDAINSRIYSTVNNGVYKAGFATTQQAYEEAFDELFETLDFLEQRLGHQAYLVGAQITEADWRLFTTLIRFDAVYYGHFKTNLRRIEEYPNVSNYLRDLYQHSGVAETVHFDHIKTHYYYSHTTINPTRVVPKGPALDFDRAHDRHRFQ